MPLRKILLLLASAVLLLAACGGSDDVEQPGEGTPSQVTGVIVDIQSEGIDDIRGFTLRTGEDTYEIAIADDVDYGFPLGHLQEHRVSAEPVIVDLEEREGRLYALSIEDA